MRWAGWERLVNWQTFLAADVNSLSQNILIGMLRTKIRTPQTIWELICLDKGGPQLADSEVRIITPAVEIPQAWSKESPTKVRGGTGCLYHHTLEAILAKMTSSRICWPQGHIPGILLKDGDVLVSLRRTDVLFTTYVVDGVSERKRNILWNHWSFQLPDLLRFELWWITLCESLWSSSI